MNNSSDSKPFPCQLARAGWIAGVIAIILIGVTARGSSRVTGELIAFALIGFGLLASIVSLATIPKFGTQNILWPALVGIAINGLLLAIAIPNFLHARQNAIEQPKLVADQNQAPPAQYPPPAAGQGNPGGTLPASWQPYRVAGLEIMSPFALNKEDAVAAFERSQKNFNLTPGQIAAAMEKAKRVEAYSGKQSDLTLSLNGRILLPDETVTTESIVNQMTNALQKRFPDGFQATSRDVTIGGDHATLLTIECEIQARTAKMENVVILTPSNLWQIQFFGPADFPQYDDTAEKIFGSAKIPSAESKPTP